MISFVIPAFNEELLLEGTLWALFAAAREVGEPFEVIVVDDASTDRTPAIAEECGARLIAVRNRQIAATRNAGARAALGEVLFFVDADTQTNAGAIRAGLTALREGAVGGGCVFRFGGPVPLWARIMLPIGVFAGRRLRIVGGCFLFCTRQAFEAAGGFCEQIYATEDIELIKALKRQGRFVVPRESVITSGRKLNAITPWMFARLMFRLVFRKPQTWQRGDSLDIWYSEGTIWRPMS